MVSSEAEEASPPNYKLSHPVKLALTIGIPLIFIAIFVGMFFYLRRVHLAAISRFEIAPGVGKYVPSRGRPQIRPGARDIETGLAVGGRRGGEKRSAQSSETDAGRKCSLAWIPPVTQILQKIASRTVHSDHKESSTSTTPPPTSSSSSPKPKPTVDGITALRQSHEAWKHEHDFKLKLSAFKLQQKQQQ